MPTGIMAVATENGCGVEIFTVPVDASGNFGNATRHRDQHDVIAPGRWPSTTLGNISFNEDTVTGNGVLFIPAGTTNLNGDTGLQILIQHPLPRRHLYRQQRAGRHSR